jgi:type IV pilus assembly protein PilB
VVAQISTLVGRELVEKGVVDEVRLGRALEVQHREPIADRRKIGDILIDDFGADRHLVYKEVASTYGFREFDMARHTLTDEQTEFVSAMLSQLDGQERHYLIEKRILPFAASKKKRDMLILLAADPTDKHIADLVIQLGYTTFEVYYTRLEDIDTLLHRLLPATNEFLEILEEMSSELEAAAEEVDNIDEDGLDAEIHQSKLTNLVEATLVEATRKKASDVHIVPVAANRVEFRFRIDGRLQVWHVQENTRPEAISAVFKDRTKNVDRFERDAAQDGFIQRRIDGALIRYRVSILPMVGAEYDRKLETIVIRVLDDRKVITDLSVLGLQDQALRDFIKSVSKPQGMVILTGPTGSGKSTTLMAALNYVMDPGLCVLTVEDPVEYLIDGARQLKINAKMDFDQALRSILRHDPDIVMLGEMRDSKTADIAIKLANTGHLTFSTLHTNDATSAISRLYKMDVEPFLIANAINMIVAQRLIRTLCSTCKRPIDQIETALPRSLEFTDEEIAQTTFYEAVGCEECNNGYRGRSAIHEALLFTGEVRRMITEASDNVNEDALRRHALDQGMLSLRMSGKKRIQQGITTCEEIAFVTADDL